MGTAEWDMGTEQTIDFIPSYTVMKQDADADTQTASSAKSSTTFY